MAVFSGLQRSAGGADCCKCSVLLRWLLQRQQLEKRSPDRGGCPAVSMARPQRPFAAGGSSEGAVAVSGCQSRSGSLNPSSTRAKKRRGVETVDEGMVKPPGHRDHAILQFSPGKRGHRRADGIFRMGHRGEVKPRQTAGADKMLTIDDERCRGCLSCRDDLRRGASLKAVNSGALSHHTWRNPSPTVITGVITARLSYSITSSLRTRWRSCGTPLAARSRA